MNLMTSLGPHASFIIWSYAIVGVVVVGMIAAVIIDYRRQQRILSALEAQGVTRRSSGERT